MFNPDTDFKYGEVVTMNLTSSITNSGSDPLVNGYVCSFTVQTTNGSGSFAAKVDYTTGNNPNAVALAYLNQDNYSDLIVVNYNDNDASVYFGQSGGTFASRIDYPI